MPPSRRRDSAAINVVRAGMLMPAASVSVAKTSLSRPVERVPARCQVCEHAGTVRARITAPPCAAHLTGGIKQRHYRRTSLEQALHRPRQLHHYFQTFS